MITLHRAEGLIDLQALSRRTLVMAGVGSLGSQTLSALAYPFARIILVDPDLMSEANVERHVLGRSAIGRPKVEAMKDYLVDKGISPDSIQTHQAPAETVLADCPDGTIVVASVDGYEPRTAINAVCYDRAFPAIFGGIYPKGTGGDVAVLPQPTNVCYLCTGWLTMPAYQGHENREYGIDPTSTLPAAAKQAIPALKAPVMAIAADMAMACLDIIAGATVEPRLMRHLHEWEAVYQFDEESERRSDIGRFISATKDLGIEPSMRLDRTDFGFTWHAKRAIVSFVLSPWTTGCFLHSPTTSLDQI